MSVTVLSTKLAWTCVVDGAGYTLDVEWVGTIPPRTDPVAIVYDVMTGRSYIYPGLDAYRGPIPPQSSTTLPNVTIRGQVLAAKPRAVVPVPQTREPAKSLQQKSLF